MKTLGDVRSPDSDEEDEGQPVRASVQSTAARTLGREEDSELVHRRCCKVCSPTHLRDGSTLTATSGQVVKPARKPAAPSSADVVKEVFESAKRCALKNEVLSYFH